MEADVGTDSLSRDEAAIPMWDSAYQPDRLNGEANLWGDPPVPHAQVAAALFAAAGASVVLDLPCGDGRNLPPLAAGAPILLAGDTSLNAMAIAEQVTVKAGVRDKVVFVKVDAFHTGLLDNSIDGVFCWDLLGHLTNPQDALREIDRILRPGGSLVANMWTMNDCQVSDPNIREIAPREYLDHFDFYCRFYDHGDLTVLLSEVGMTATSVEVASWWEPPHAGYRDYVHQHESLIFRVRKPAM
jgi:ubiquinone/menaquinone biosynthesis C-methylase UbiE